MRKILTLHRSYVWIESDDPQIQVAINCREVSSMDLIRNNKIIIWMRNGNSYNVYPKNPETLIGTISQRGSL